MDASAVGMEDHDTDGVSGVDSVTDSDARKDALVRRPPAGPTRDHVRVLNADDGLERDASRHPHDTRCGCSDDRARAGGQIDPAMAGRVRTGRGQEGPFDDEGMEGAVPGSTRSRSRRGKARWGG